MSAGTAFVNAIVEESVRQIRFGVLTIIVQDGKVVQLERTEKFQVQAVQNKTVQAEKINATVLERVREHICQEMTGMRYGQILVKIVNGRVNQIEKTEKRRWAGACGLDGEGI
ncbi:YezD family protein [Azotosporobacter soli]|uniref:YezD family protein n=1 Tax=Azotosporobacter soli TaxID=3055040 RepID=UPI0031FECF3B